MQSKLLQTFGNDGSDVDTKPRPGETFGNDTSPVDTTREACDAFRNDAGLGFIRVRKRELKGPYWRAYGHNGYWALSSVSFDLVRAVRINGKSRHQFILGLGSQKNTATGRDAAYLLLRAIGRMKRHGLDEPRRRALLAELIRKGVRRPTIAECERWDYFSFLKPYIDELVPWLRDGDAP